MSALPTWADSMLSFGFLTFPLFSSPVWSCWKWVNMSCTQGFRSIILLQSHLCCNCCKISNSSGFLHLIKLDYIRKARDFFNQESDLYLFLYPAAWFPVVLFLLLDAAGPSSVDLRDVRGWHAALFLGSPHSVLPFHQIKRATSHLWA